MPPVSWHEARAGTSGGTAIFASRRFCCTSPVRNKLLSTTKHDNGYPLLNPRPKKIVRRQLQTAATQNLTQQRANNNDIITQYTRQNRMHHVLRFEAFVDGVKRNIHVKTEYITFYDSKLSSTVLSLNTSIGKHINAAARTALGSTGARGRAGGCSLRVCVALRVVFHDFGLVRYLGPVTVRSRERKGRSMLTLPVLGRFLHDMTSGYGCGQR